MHASNFSALSPAAPHCTASPCVLQVCRPCSSHTHSHALSPAAPHCTASECVLQVFFVLPPPPLSPPGPSLCASPVFSVSPGHVPVSPESRAAEPSNHISIILPLCLCLHFLPFTLCPPVVAPVGAGRFLLAGNRWQLSCAVECGLDKRLRECSTEVYVFIPFSVYSILSCSSIHFS